MQKQTQSFCWTKNKRNLLFCCFITRIITLISYCCFISASDLSAQRDDGNLFCHDIGSIQGRSFFFLFWSAYLLISKPKHLLQQKCAVEATKSNCLHLHRVEICLRKIRSRRCRSQNWGFSAYVISGESAKGPKKLWNHAFHVKTSQSAKN